MQERAYDVKTTYCSWCDQLTESTRKWKEGAQPKEPF